MQNKSRKKQQANEEEAGLTITPKSVCYIIVKVREYGAKDQVTEPDPGSNPADDNMVSVLESHGDDPVVEEMSSFISDLSDDEQIDLVALAWLGRDDNTLEDWASLREEAARSFTRRRNYTANYILGTPLIGDYLEEGLALFGHSCGNFDIERL